ncbi:hypothetical protein [Bacillus sp. ISL-75]|uniref:hypothetical protein n=2 Tax=unclassified Bacillus (in: firmicutes) TaxID=185979 RepID=UPI001BE94A89|nr:hypothetical protein [Bacillus sp. ISL-75]
MTKNFGFKSDHTNQLIGYYLLDFYEKLPEEDKQRFTKIGLFFPRQDQFVYMDMADLRRDFDLDDFANQFYKIIYPLC